MQSNRTKNMEKIFTQFTKLAKIPKLLLKYGSRAFLVLFAIGTLLVVLNRSILGYDAYIELIAQNIIRSSFTIFAEVVIGSLLMDFIFKKN